MPGLNQENGDDDLYYWFLERKKMNDDDDDDGYKIMMRDDNQQQQQHHTNLPRLDTLIDMDKVTFFRVPLRIVIKTLQIYVYSVYLKGKLQKRITL